MVVVLVLGVIFLLSGHPLMSVSCLVMLSLVYALGVYMNMGVFWFGGVLMMVMLSGVMVLFTYMASLSPNEVFELKGVVAGVGLLLMGWVVGSFSFLMEDTSFFSVSMWEDMMVLLNLYMLLLLLVSMVGVVWLSWRFKGAVSVECEQSFT